ncbi:hypothetical protein KSP24_02995 [Paenibacillus sp. AK121]|uniref:hypothetical protein n=1 Tax=Paenibacillus sp. AK121 TaxID=2849670 RepID=UPI001C245074|nr:hypothetical protein [Paenibacillus sp. AK121]MBU9705892.1 hypothetical protein [Paenibacillus sp. AK121]
MLLNVTVLPDESLGGIKREYREVKRKAVTGERIKITAGPEAFFGQDFRRTIHEVTDVVGFNVKTTGKWKDGSVLNPSHDDYVVLEPTAAVYVDDPDGVGRKYRMVDRKAAVGERVIIVNNELPSNYEVGEVFNVQRYGEETESLYGGIYIAELCGRRGQNVEGFVRDGKYRVLEPLATALLSEQSAQDQAAATIGALALRLDALTERMDALEAQVTQVTQPTTTVDTEVVLKAVRKFSEGLKRSVSDALKTPQQRRDEIVERAKADVADLLSHNYPDAAVAGVWLSERDWITVTDECEFAVNRKKRTVVALIRELETGKKNVILRGIARCAPNDVFNAHIGKAIALYRALGLEVPAEYLNVPQPTEVRKGDAVRSTSGIYAGVKGYVDEITYGDSSPSGVFFKHSRANRRDGRIYKNIRFVEVIDDTREGVAA